MKKTKLTHELKNRALSVTPETGGSFRVRYAAHPLPPAEDGTMLAPDRKNVGASLRKNVISTKAGTIQLAVSGKSLSLLTPQGTRLITLSLKNDHILLKSAKSGDSYGGGDAGNEAFPGNRVKNQPLRLIKKTRIRSFVGNGVSVVPFIWHSSGWALLLLAEDEPAEIRPLDKTGKSFRLRNTRKLVDLVVVPVPDHADALRWLADISGHAPVPPRWALGFMHCRWGYKTFEEIRDTWKQFRERKHPLDTFIYDFEWYTPKPDYSLKPHGRRDYEDFGWNTKLFFDPIEQIAESRSLNIRTVGIRKPRLGNRNLLKRVVDRNWDLASVNSAKPGADVGMDSRTMDFRKKDARDWYWERNRPLMEQGMDGWWNDEGEQFATLYYWWNRSQLDGQERDFPNTRFWTTNRAYTIGLARTGASVWTGDSRSGWPDLRTECLKMLNGGLSGMPWITCDLGGFYGNPKPELMTRYMQMGVFFPVMRTHSCSGAVPRTPWNFGDEAEVAIRRALEWRYRMLPYTNSLAHETNRTGLPLSRPMMLEFTEKSMSNIWEQWMYGPSILAAPVLDENGTRKVILPRGCSWYDLETNIPVSGGRELHLDCTINDMPAWQRSGSILPLSPVIQHSGELEKQTLEIRVAPGSNAGFTLVEDDGTTLAYRKKEHLDTKWGWNERRRTLKWSSSGSCPDIPKTRKYLIRILGSSDTSSVSLNGKRLPRTKGKRGWSINDDGSLIIRPGALPVTGKHIITVK